MNKYHNVFSPLKIGNVTVKNRIETPPMLSCMATPDGFVTREMIEFYKQFARGGAGIVTIGDAAIDFDYAPGHLWQLNLGDDRVVTGLNLLVEAIQRYGAKISIEINHAGRWSSPKVLNGKNPIGPSSIPVEGEEKAALMDGRKKVQVTEMNLDMIDRVVDNFASACYRCLMAGFEMVMLHGGHGHLLAQFASPYSNKRTDNYGGSLENRARFAREVLTAIRRKVGDRLAIEYRISADEIVPGGMRVEDTIEFIKLIQDEIDLVHVSLGVVAEPKYGPYTIQPTYFPLAFNVQRAEQIKRAVRVPVTCVGSIVDLETADKIIGEEKADVVAMGRAHIADPAIVNKTYHGELDDIRPCIRCVICSDRVRTFYQPRCAVNPVIGRELEYSYIRPAEKSKKVVIVGGGPAGMKAAQIASSRGHNVVLFEKEAEMGGALRYAAALPFKTDMKKYLDWMARKTLESDIEIKLNTEASADSIKVNEPDVLILAVGAEPLIPDIPGIKQPNVVWAGDVNMGNADTKDKVVVVGAGMTGCETALYLAQQGKKVTVIDMISESEIAQDATEIAKAGLLTLLEQHNVEFITEVKLQEVTRGGVLVIDKKWNRFDIPSDTVVLSMGAAPQSDTLQDLQGLAREVYHIGDCQSPRNLMAAIHDAFNVATEI